MKRNQLLVSVLAILFASFTYGQKITLIEGDFGFLKSEKNINVKYDYSNFSVGEFSNEGDYKKKRITELNAKESGAGDRWSASWERDKEVRYPEKFEELINKGFASSGISFKQNSDAKYTLIVKTTFIEPGFNIGVVRKSAAVSFDYIWVESANPSKVVAKQTQKMVPGAQAMGYDFDTGTRIAESYAKGGKMLAADVVKKLK
jgi:hypothetical protein